VPARNGARIDTKEGFLADPIHGGNKNLGSWKMIGIPGERADFLDWVVKPGVRCPLGPVCKVFGTSKVFWVFTGRNN